MKMTKFRRILSYAVVTAVTAVALAVTVFSPNSVIRAVANFALFVLFGVVLIIYVRANRASEELHEKSIGALASVSKRAFFEWDYNSSSLTTAANFDKVFDNDKVNICTLEEAAVKGYIAKADLKLFTDTVSAMMRAASHEKMRVRIKNKAGEFVWYAFSYEIMYAPSGKAERAVGFIENINFEVEAELLAQLTAQTDPLTGLSSRTSVENQIKNALGGINRGEHHALFIISMDNIDKIKSEVSGDKPQNMITDFASGVKALFRGNDIVGRISDNEFAVLMKYYTTPSIIATKAAALCELAAGTSFVGKHKYTLSIKTGVAAYPDNASDYSDLLLKADRARKSASPGSFHIYQN